MGIFNIKDKSQQPEVTPASKDTALLSFLHKAFKDSEQFMRSQRNRWRRNERLYKGNHLVALNNDPTTPQIQLQLVLKTIETERPTVAASIPKYGALPRDIDDVMIASVVNRIKEGYENKGDSLESALQDITFSYKHDGNALWSHFPIFDSKGNLIDFTFESLDIFGWFPSPDSTDVDIFKNSSYQIFAKVMSLKDIKATYGVQAQAESNLGRFKSNRDDAVAHTDNSFANDSDHALVKQIYFNDQKNIEEFPTGRTITWIGNIIPEKFDRPIWGEWRPDSDSEFKGFMPFKMAKNHGRKFSLFGMGEPEVIETMSHSANEQASAIAMNIMLTGNNQRRIDPDFANQLEIEVPRGPGADIKARKGDVELLQGAPVQPSMFAFLESLIAFTQEGSGATRELEGGKPAGVDSGRGILALQRQAVSRLEELTRANFSRPMKAMTEFELWAIQQWAGTVTIRETEFQEPLPLASPVQVPDAVTISESGGFRFTQINFSDINKNTLFDIEIEQGHVFPEGSLAQFELLQGLFTQGLLPPEYLIQHAPIKNKAAVMQWVKANQANLEIAQQQEAANKEFSNFESLVKEANRMTEQQVSPEEFANTLTAANLSLMIDQFKSYLETNEWFSVSQEYKNVIIQVFLETPQEDVELEAAQSESPQNQSANGGIDEETAALLQRLSQSKEAQG